MDALTLSSALSPPLSALDADDLSSYLRKDSDGRMRFEVAVKGAHCAGCLAKIEGGVKKLDGVDSARLNLSTGKLTVLMNQRGPGAHAVLACIRALGYGAAPFEADIVLDAGRNESRRLLHCLAVAGFGAVFTVGLTDAVWYGGEDMSAMLRKSFFWLAAAVAIPVTLYAGQPFFRSASMALGKRRTNMDVPISLALILSLGLSVYQTAKGGAATYFDAATMLVFLLLIGRYLDLRLRERAQGAGRQLLAMQAALARRLGADGAVATVPARELLPGDRILLASGERAPVNGRLEDRGTLVDLSLVTGESEPRNLPAGAEIDAGAVITGAPVILKATAAMEDSLVADLARLLEAGQQRRSVYVSLADRAARAYVPFVTGLALIVLIGQLIAGHGWGAAVTGAITVLIITCPCALGLAVPAVQIAATSRLFQDGVLIKSGNALERLAAIDIAVFDKTGTLTLGKPVLANQADISPASLERAAELARASCHPYARAIAAAAGAGPVAAGVREVAGAGLLCEEQGVARKLGSASWVLNQDNAGGELWFADGDAAPVRFVLKDHIRPETHAMLDDLRRRGVEVRMLTGDQEGPAQAIAHEANISRWRSSIGPLQKADYLKQLRAEGHRVLMVGDGINDAGAMALAHVSMAPGGAADVSQLAADMVVRGDSLSPLVQAVDVARKAKRLVLQNFALAVLYNLTAIPMAALGLVAPLVAAATMAGSSLIVTLNALRLAKIS
ncbi:MAG TPA: heavy metal translocating P-type ATPase [Rhizomicrobium sp.]|nr:heavy metal translocating P-type ATPase [Rhizomicrobium sp.]